MRAPGPCSFDKHYIIMQGSAKHLTGVAEADNVSNVQREGNVHSDGVVVHKHADHCTHHSHMPYFLLPAYRICEGSMRLSVGGRSSFCLLLKCISCDERIVVRSGYHKALAFRPHYQPINILMIGWVLALSFGQWLCRGVARPLIVRRAASGTIGRVSRPGVFPLRIMW
jgi:hypothetical protein